MSIAAAGQVNSTEPPAPEYRTVDEFEKLELIGEGSYGQVYKAREIATGEVVALKKIRIEDQRREEGRHFTCISEIKILNTLRHDNIVRLKEIVTSPVVDGGENKNDEDDSVYMVFEYMEHDLKSLLRRRGIKFSIPQIKCYMKQLLTGLHYCHSNHVLHRDVKSENMLVDNEGNLKLADFGLARTAVSNDVNSRDDDANLTNRVVTLWDRAPELLLGATNYGPAVDMWSAGCIFADLLRRGRDLLPGKDEADQIRRIFELCGAPDEDNWPGVADLPEYETFKPAKPIKRKFDGVFRNLDPDALELMERMLTLDPSRRISAEEALEAEYFKTEPLACDPKTLPKYESALELKKKRKEQQQRRQEEQKAKRQKKRKK